MTEPELLNQIEARLQVMLEGGMNGEADAIERLKRESTDSEKMIGNLIRLAEEGSIGGDSVRIRVNELEAEKQRTLAKLSAATAPREKVNLADLRQEMARFVLDFERNFAQARMEERKLLVQKCISKIVVDRKARVARFYVRRVPAVNPALEETAKCSKNDEDVMSNLRARNRT